MQISNLNFLIAEDNEFQRRWLVIMLTNLGAKNIIEVADGRAALQIFQTHRRPIDISFIDLNMPDMDGLELIRHMAKEDHPGAIILASALDPSLLFSVETMSKAYGVNLLGAFEKPATPENLLALINQYKPPYARRQAAAVLPAFSAEDILAGMQADQFEPLFQPKVEFSTGHVHGAEAFARWRHPQYGWLLPDTFLPVLEQHGAMDELARIIIDKSAIACKTWIAQGFRLAVSVNISPSSLQKSGFAETVIAQVARHAIPPENVVIEVTESGAITNVPHFLENLARLRMKGFGVAVDDYGTGHANIQQLMQIPFSELKIDRSFVAGASQNQALQLVLSMSLELCRKLNRQSVAVGVETRQDWDLLLGLGCLYAQGYYVAKPMEAEALPGWMKEWAQFF